MVDRMALPPEWVSPTVHAVKDCHWLAHGGAEEFGPASGYAHVLQVLEWLAGEQPTREQAEDRMMAADGIAYDTIVWLFGHKSAPIDLPYRNPDGSLMTEQQLYAEYMAGRNNGPEERNAARTWAHMQAARSQRLAAKVPR